MNNKINSYSLPQIIRETSVGNGNELPLKESVQSKESSNEFDQLLSKQILGKEEASSNVDVEFSNHALKRLKQRNLEIDNDEFLKLKQGIEKLKNKGGQDSLIVTNRAAYIVDVNNNRIVTAMDKNDLGENVFTKIDSTVFIN